MRSLDSKNPDHGSKSWKGTQLLTAVAVVLFVATTPLLSSAQNADSSSAPGSGGTAIVRVVTEPELGTGTFKFTGEPSGELTLLPGQPVNLTSADLAPGNHVTKLSEVDPLVTAAGYTLTDIRCDDQESAERSSGSLDSRTAIFRIEEGETVTCVFVLSVGGCLCPKEGSWAVTNHTGSMVCTGSMNMTVPLAASSSSGAIAIFDGCARFVGSGMSNDEADVEVHLQDDCSYKGSVGGSQDGIPMVIDFTMQVHDSERITGDLHSEVSQQGTTCVMTRTYELEYSGP